MNNIKTVINLLDVDIQVISDTVKSIFDILSSLETHVKNRLILERKKLSDIGCLNNQEYLNRIKNFEKQLELFNNIPIIRKTKLNSMRDYIRPYDLSSFNIDIIGKNFNSIKNNELSIALKSILLTHTRTYDKDIVIKEYMNVDEEKIYLPMKKYSTKKNNLPPKVDNKIYIVDIETFKKYSSTRNDIITPNIIPYNDNSFDYNRILKINSFLYSNDSNDINNSDSNNFNKKISLNDQYIEELLDIIFDIHQTLFDPNDNLNNDWNLIQRDYISRNTNLESIMIDKLNKRKIQDKYIEEEYDEMDDEEDNSDNFMKNFYNAWKQVNLLKQQSFQNQLKTYQMMMKNFSNQFSFGKNSNNDEIKDKTKKVNRFSHNNNG